MQRNEAIRLKEEYYSFLDKISIMLFCFSSALLLVDYLRPHSSDQFSFTPPYMGCVQLFLCWLLYVYTALALRENVLKVGLPRLKVEMHELLSTVKTKSDLQDRLKSLVLKQ